jgi:hypothetical protein
VEPGLDDWQDVGGLDIHAQRSLQIILRCLALLSFMLEDELASGCILTSGEEKGTLAECSHQWNIEQGVFRNVFPEVGISISFARLYLTGSIV